MNKKVIFLLVIFMILYISVGSITQLYVDYEWFKINNAENVFYTLFFTKFNVRLLFAGIFAGIFLLNFLLIRILGGKGKIFSENILDRFKIPYLGSPRKVLFIIIATGVLFMSFLMGGIASQFWKEYLMFNNAFPFTGLKPVPFLNAEIGFYIFSLPFYNFLYGWLMSSLVLVTLFSVFFHVINGGIYGLDGKPHVSIFARVHLSSLFSLIVFLHGIGYKLSAYELLLSDSGKFFGAGYTAINANLIAYKVAMVISFIAAAIFLFNIFKKSFILPVIVLASILPAFFILNTIFPALQQKFIVKPNELDKEKPYITQNIKYTRLAYNLHNLKEKDFSNKKNLTYRDIQKNKHTIQNVRLWDWRPLKQTYTQLQRLKPYYYFSDVDVDRYTINKKKFAVNVSARELSIDLMDKNTQTWQNQHLIYTHGYGAVLSRVDKITSEGQPELLVYDIPPKSKSEITINRPEIYYGEHNNKYVITNTTIKPGEFDYPSGKTNKYTTYNGTGGTKFDSFLKKIMFALYYKDINILISGNINNESKILYRRNIKEIVSTLTPFLDFDNDPYLVVSKGKLYYFLDGYTSTDLFPYSTRLRIGIKSINYIRNSVKVIIDAYNGKVSYYISDNKDPIIKSYNKIFPGIFKNISEMPEDLKAHIRYPEEIFNIQAHILLKYHMTNPDVFYVNDDIWEIPKQIYEGSEEFVRSYYLVTKLPKEKNTEFILIKPFSPMKLNTMIAFLIAKCDGDNYGELTLYSLPKDKLNYGPLQIEARIDQNPEISELLTLWGQKGSSVIRGNMLIIPIEESLIYIEPLYLKAESSQMPELKRVIVSYADQVVMEENLDMAIEKIFSRTNTIQSNFIDTETPYNEQMKSLSLKAYSHYSNSEKSIKNGDWKKYGEELKALKETLVLMKNLKEIN